MQTSPKANQRFQEEKCITIQVNKIKKVFIIIPYFYNQNVFYIKKYDAKNNTRFVP